jgi:hypothetical protein
MSCVLLGIIRKVLVGTITSSTGKVATKSEKEKGERRKEKG